MRLKISYAFGKITFIFDGLPVKHDTRILQRILLQLAIGRHIL